MARTTALAALVPPITALDQIADPGARRAIQGLLDLVEQSRERLSGTNVWIGDRGYAKSQ